MDKTDKGKRKLEEGTAPNGSRATSPSWDFTTDPEHYTTDGGATTSRSKRQRTNIAPPSAADIPPTSSHFPFSDASRRDDHLTQTSNPLTEGSLPHPERRREISFKHHLSHQLYLTLSYNENGYLDDKNINNLNREINKRHKLIEGTTKKVPITLTDLIKLKLYLNEIKAIIKNRL